ncbi:hydrolase [Caenispirillum salinarum AK4]|uniref:Beta-phosphoglucomutase n=1 Tax=Caenispirillum salinarum AK4 TaxID=1238182 RepID=K9GZ32_9PROT|nr:beta-phosphoglucomutase family hydrolase [Caenispirillum salinarum]EKV30557.1 hydrolase [Caenispirillum salinarum AK4]
MPSDLPRPTQLGLKAIVYDLDGVVTRTADLHAAAWKDLFDAYLKDRAARTGEPFQPFDIATDYMTYVDGKPRYDGVRSFLESRGIALPFGAPGDGPEQETVCGLGNRKNALFRKVVEENGVTVFPGARRFIEDTRAAGIRAALCSSSKNARLILEQAGMLDLFDYIMDGIVAAEMELPGKPKPDTFIEAARQVDATPADSAIVEDATVGVEAGRAGGFALTIGIDRGAGADILREHGADVVVSDLGDFERV